MPERFKVTRSSADLGGSGGLGSGIDLRPRNGSRHHDEEAATGRLLPQRNYPGEYLTQSRVVTENILL